MKKLRNLIGLVLVTVMLLGTFAGCNLGIETGGGEDIDEAKTQLYIAMPDDGWGTAGMYAMKDMFEEEYKDVSFEEGKMGVQVVIDSDKMSYAGTNLISMLGSTTNEVFFSSMIAYHRYATDKFLDITDIVTADMADVGEPGKTILGKINGDNKEYYKINNKYYALPHTVAFPGLHYNVDLFEDNLLYFAKNANNGNQGFVRTPVDKRGTGPDGIEGTYDDGLPRTYDEFFKLCDRMKSMNISPWINVSGRYAGYTNDFLASLWVDYEGAEQAKMRFTMNGTATHIVDSIDSNGNVTFKGNGNYTITDANAYELYQQAGTYYAMTFLEKIIKNNYYASNTFLGSASHTSIQADFVYTGVVPGVEKVAMLAESSWWYPETKDTFTSLSSTYPNADAYSRNIAVMPLPKATEDKVGEKPTIAVSGDGGLCFIKNNISEGKKELAKLFLKWCHTDRALSEYAVKAHTIRDFSFTMTDESYTQLAPWTRSLYEYLKVADIMYCYSRHDVYVGNPASFYKEDMFWTKVNGESYRYPSEAIKDFGLSAKDYFLGMKNYYNSEFWNRFYAD